MIGLWIIVGCLTALAVVLAVAALRFYGERKEGFAWISGGAATIAGVSAFIFMAITIGCYVERASCASWERETGRESRFVFYTPVTWDCLAKTQDGTWLPKEQLREFGEDAQ